MNSRFFLLAPMLLFLGAAPPESAAPAPREVSFATADSGTVVADLYGHGERGVVLAHGAVFNKESWADLAGRLAGLGYQALPIDFRGYGKSVAGSKKRGLYEDVLAGVRYLHHHGAKEVSVIGASMGGGASARAATEAKPGEIDRLILLSPVPIAHPESLHVGSVLYVASRDERLAKKVRAQFERAPEPKRLLLLDGDAHAQNIFKTDRAERLTMAIVEALGAAPPAEPEKRP
jgi:pimeloyl-ACP methyl ester carboxylesterase